MLKSNITTVVYRRWNTIRISVVMNGKTYIHLPADGQIPHYSPSRIIAKTTKPCAIGCDFILNIVLRLPPRII